MKFWKKLALGAVATVSVVFSLHAEEAVNYEATKSIIQSTLGLKVDGIAESPIPGLLQVTTDKGLFYSSQDGQYFMQGRIFNLKEGMRNETEVSLAVLRKDGVERFSDSMIEYKAKNEKYVVNVFTDITCGYCRKMHNQMADYNKLGITIRYLAFPRGGLNSSTYADMASVWCSADPQSALTHAKGGENVETHRCSNNVAQQYEFGQRVGVTGTPNMILPDGSMIPGYKPPGQLLEALKAI